MLSNPIRALLHSAFSAGQIVDREKRAASIPQNVLRYWEEVDEIVKNKVSKLPDEEQAKAAKGQVSVNPLFPASGLATGSLNGLNPKSKFLALMARRPNT